MSRVNPFFIWLSFGSLLVISSASSLITGALEIPREQLLIVLQQSFGFGEHLSVPSHFEITLLEFRLPRLLLALMVGAALAISGAAIQGLFRNPLADPGLIGVSSGAAFGAVLVIVLGDTLLSDFNILAGQWALPISAFAFGLLTTLIIYQIATRGGHTQVSTVLLAGIAMNAVASAGIGILTYVADDVQLRSLTFWSMGSLAKASWNDIKVVAPFILIPACLLPLLASALNGFLMGESVASHLGFSIRWTKRAIILLTSLAVGAAVSMTGVIGFLGLVIPHLIRFIFGPDHRLLLPASALCGALFLTLADMLARTIVAPAELPIGLIMALIGGPFFLFLLLRPGAALQKSL